MTTRRFSQVDVFSSLSYYGNPVAVVLDGDNLTDQQMQQFASWTNLSETTFIVTPQDPIADYGLRIFTPSRELPFAGHPTIGSCYAWLLSGGIAKDSSGLIIQECKKGLIKLKKCNDLISFQAPSLNRSGPLPESDLNIICVGLGISRDEIVAHSWCDNGPNWRGILLESDQKVLSLQPNALLLEQLDVGVIGPRCQIGTSSEEGDDNYDFEVRAFCPADSGPLEDPVTGSLNAAFAQWLIGSGMAPEKGYVVRQGTVIGRNGRIYITRSDDGGIWLGGKSTICISGVVTI